MSSKLHTKRCSWVTEDPIYKEYHDEEWGNIEHFKNDHYLFEMLTLEGAQAGLSWLTILKRRENYRAAFAQFDPAKVALYEDDRLNRLMNNKGIIRNRRKIVSTIQNAKVLLQVQQEYGSFHAFLWNFAGEQQMNTHPQVDSDVPASTEESLRLSKTLKKHGFSFVGPIICYSFMQAVGLVNDHTAECFLYDEKRDI